MVAVLRANDRAAFGLTVGVDVSGVDERAADLDECVELFERCVLVGFGTERHCTERRRDTIGPVLPSGAVGIGSDGKSVLVMTITQHVGVHSKSSSTIQE